MNSQESNEIKTVVIYFQVHQPRRLRRFRFLDIGAHDAYFDDQLNEKIINRVSQNCYLPNNITLLNLIKANPAIRIAYSISGVALEQFQQYAPEVIESFKALANTGCVEFLAETSHHSLASMMPGTEFQSQVRAHCQTIENLFGVHPTVFRNTELIYNDEVGRQAASMGFDGILCEGVEQTLGDRSTYRVYHHPDGGHIKLLLRANRLSDDIAFRFHHGETLTTTRYVGWLNAIPAPENIIVLGMDYETFGEHHKTESGVCTFLQDVLTRISAETNLRLATPSEALKVITPSGQFSTTSIISWADKNKDSSAWLGNDMQLDAFNSIVTLEPEVRKSHNTSMLNIWKHLLTSDHFYYMSTKDQEDGDVHSYFSPYQSPYEAFINYINVVNAFAFALKNAPMDDSESSRHQEMERRTHVPPAWAEHLAAAYKQEAHIGN
jgi:alpha-amylase